MADYLVFCDLSS